MVKDDSNIINCPHVCPGHFHVPTDDGGESHSKMAQWLTLVERRVPSSSISCDVPLIIPPVLETRPIYFAPGTHSLLVRVIKCHVELPSHTPIDEYTLSFYLRDGNSSTTNDLNKMSRPRWNIDASCRSVKGLLQDYFVFRGLEADVMGPRPAVEIFVNPVCGRKGFFRKAIQSANIRFRRIGGTNGIDNIKDYASSLRETPACTIPLGLLVPSVVGSVSSVKNNSAQLLNTFYLVDGMTTIGTITLHVILSDGALLETSLVENSIFKNHNQFVTVYDDISNSWFRVFASIARSALTFYRSEDLGKIDQAAHNGQIDLTSVVGVQFFCSSSVMNTCGTDDTIELCDIKGHYLNSDETHLNANEGRAYETHLLTCGGIDYLVKLDLDDGSNICLYADDAEAGHVLANALHFAVWDQPYPF